MNKEGLQELRRIADKLDNLEKSGNQSKIPEIYAELTIKVVALVKEETGISEARLPSYWSPREIPACSNGYHQWSVGCEELGEKYFLDIKKGTLKPFIKEKVGEDIFFVPPDN